ncbi:hypothetical protein AWW67_05750 [Roseivirga seohaensis]|uniref:Uncharacterized protein n=1 Tax=Roseivirga seohaensis TaxID=1914963 RepID=A0A150XW05_9BACT|nr:hypothetical protein AWW67_05750 [Roseivirga seohaensis]
MATENLTKPLFLSLMQLILLKALNYKRLATGKMNSILIFCKKKSQLPNGKPAPVNLKTTIYLR